MADLTSLLGEPVGSSPAKATNHEVHVKDHEWAGRLRVAESFNEHIPSTWDDAFLASMPTKAAPRVSLAVSTDLKQWNYRYMFEKKGERSLVLDTRLNTMAEVLQQAFGLATDWEDPTIPNQESIYTIGRICQRVSTAKDEAAKAPAKLTTSELMLETSRMVGNGQRVALSLDPKCRVRYAWTDESASMTSVVGLFPGMIVGLKGRNGSGGRFIAEEILMPPALPHPATSRAELQAHQYHPSKLDGSTLRIVAASGPFTSPDDLAFTPWHAFASHMERLQPDVLLVMGPFLSASHPLVAAGDLDMLPTELFQEHIAKRLARLMERSPSTMVILVPSTEDLFHPHCAFPQPFLDKADPALGLPKRVRCLPNPSVFYVNELAIGVATVDVLGDLRREELVQRVQPTNASGTPGPKVADPMLRLSRHILGQRSFYPIFPPSPASNVSLDLSHSHLCDLDQVTPDVLLLPSAKIKSFVRVVDSTVVVNPGTLAPPTSDAQSTAFVCMQVDPLPRSTVFRGEEEAEELITHELYNRARIDLVHTSTA
ncbi:DNA-directed DNA polymerase alpha subunit pol12 [Malassezia caprae]|uniref:DNA polymerase alpha subunit B n=1 Tax=Malassezia caprae TaxID=1381934 RepID=A0AAF0E4P2_9BASI|nr:DNA-directed DNA polymerase alpha subunit pol12 [Malassezia caprae]